ncbi:DUF3151 domain-containing protein [Mycetocola tolaasinivorans]|uniref:DUF3151 domain-containing protein n=1 Tax=Mycetocola tolaasinivorans TaxID=76635 RepID=A0A3L7A2W8_9MICO|nr:DUF3151 domain-containing protein [Mycetocola tolaasinivorans]RLP74527.1 DUF3151 domain-containing protein [Mycetocola tolaasinivorans]
MTEHNLLGIPETRLPDEPEVSRALKKAVGIDELEAIVAANPSSSLAWSAYAAAIANPARPIAGYSAARVAYHRGLDALRKAGWRGQGPIPWSHEPNRGVLRALYLLRRAALDIGETAEVTRLTEFLRDADETAIAQIENENTPVEPAPTTEAFFIRGLD